jgi:hypothetical protein
MRKAGWQSKVKKTQNFGGAASEMPSTCHDPCGTLGESEQLIGGTDMPLQNHLTELERRHQALEREIQDAMSHPSTDSLKVAELKRRKLQLKDEIAKLKQSSNPRVVH